MIYAVFQDFFDCPSIKFVYTFINGSLSMASYMLLIVVMSLALARPFKNKWHNIINTALFTALLVTYLSIVF